MSFQLKSVAVAALLLSSSIALAGHNYKDVAFKDAAPCPAAPQLMDGFYIGVQGGYDAYDVKANSSIAGVGSNNVDLNVKGWVGGLMLGYGKYFNNLYYLGGEVFGNYSNASENFNTSDTDGVTPIAYNGKVNVNGSYGLALLPGFKINDATLGYVRLGYNWASIKYQESETGVGSASKTNTSGGFVYGVGMETLIAANWSVRAEYTYTNYNSFNTSLGAGTSVEPADNQFMLGLLYHFS
jgi:outer membrane immunogenic protein